MNATVRLAADKDVGLIGRSHERDAIRVFRSDLKPEGPTYTVIHTSPLNA